MRLSHVAPARSVKAMVVLVALWVVLACGWLLLEAQWWIAGGLVLFTLPLLAELVTGKVARLDLDDTRLAWQSGRLEDSIALSEIAHVRLDRRLDGTMRVTIVLNDARKLRLPQDCVPPTQTFEEALQAHGVRSERHPFSLFG